MVVVVRISNLRRLEHSFESNVRAIFSTLLSTGRNSSPKFLKQKQKNNQQLNLIYSKDYLIEIKINTNLFNESRRDPFLNSTR